jgi:hypothetical protein
MCSISASSVRDLICRGGLFVVDLSFSGNKIGRALKVSCGFVLIPGTIIKDCLGNLRMGFDNETHEHKQQAGSTGATSMTFKGGIGLGLNRPHPKE